MFFAEQKNEVKNHVNICGSISFSIIFLRIKQPWKPQMSEASQDGLEYDNHMALLQQVHNPFQQHDDILVHRCCSISDCRWGTG